MPRYQQRARLTFNASDGEHARDVEDVAVTELNRAGARLACQASLQLGVTAPRQVETLPRVALIVSAAQAIAAAAGLLEGEAAAPVQLELSGTVLNVTQGDESESYDLAGQPVPYGGSHDSAGPTLVLSASELARQVAQAVACGRAEAPLSRPIAGDEDSEAGA